MRNSSHSVLGVQLPDSFTWVVHRSVSRSSSTLVISSTAAVDSQKTTLRAKDVGASCEIASCLAQCGPACNPRAARRAPHTCKPSLHSTQPLHGMHEQPIESRRSSIAAQQTLLCIMQHKGLSSRMHITAQQPLDRNHAFSASTASCSTMSHPAACTSQCSRHLRADTPPRPAQQDAACSTEGCPACSAQHGAVT